LCSNQEISFADLLKIRSKINAVDEDINIRAFVNDYYGDEEMEVYWVQDIENPKYQDQMKKYHQDVEKFNLKSVEHKAKLKEYEHKLEEYKMLKAEFIRQKAEQDLNSLLKR
jgi:hypothetical protein